jgi:hypothetical protein
MLRFKPDHWVDALLRPVLMGDPSAGLYYELSAPDWRFAALVLVVLLAWTVGRGRAQAQAPQRQALLMLAALFYIWTLTIGNGRYFIVGLLMVGPLLVMAWQWLPGGRGWRWLGLLALLTVQGLTLHWSYRPEHWVQSTWRHGPSIQVDDSHVRRSPAIFVTVSTNSYSALVPFFHPESRWLKLGEHMVHRPGSTQERSMLAMLESDLPTYVLTPVTSRKGRRNDQPDETLRRTITLMLSAYPLALADARCVSVGSSIAPADDSGGDRGQATAGAFWLCPLRRTERAPAPADPSEARARQVFARVEAYCPRFFPASGGITQRGQDHWRRYYPIADTRLFVDDRGGVSYRYYRSVAEVPVGSAEDVLAGRLNFDCSRLIGRYRPPWQ